MPYTWLLFDADGTLFDCERAEAAALEKAFAQLGEPFKPAYLHTYRQINRDIWQEFEQGLITAARRSQTRPSLQRPWRGWDIRRRADPTHT